MPDHRPHVTLLAKKNKAKRIEPFIGEKTPKNHLICK